MKEMMEIQDKAKREERMLYMTKRAEPGSQSNPYNPYSPTIYRVPETIRFCDKAAYEPQIISIGPYHRGLRAEDIKYQYLHDFLHRNSHRSLEYYFKEVQKSEEQARGRYSEEILLDQLDFTEVMVLDGCFVIELFLKLWEGRAANDDPVYSHTWVMNGVAHDLLLFENQLPFFILDSLYGIPEVYAPSLVQISLNYFSWLKHTTEVKQESKSIHHLLHLVHSHLFPQPIFPSSTPRHTLSCTRISPFCPSGPYFGAREAKLLPTHSRPWPNCPIMPIPSAARLIDTGVTFSKQMVPKSLLDITFNFSSGKIEIPHLYVDEGTNSFFRNLLAFEQCLPSAGVEFTSYIKFIDYLVNTVQDVEILGSHGIIENRLGSDEELALLFNRMCTGILIGDEETQISRVMMKAKVYSESKRHVERATLMRDYFGSPWSIISVIAAALVILLTLLQTIFTFLSYFNGSS